MDAPRNGMCAIYLFLASAPRRSLAAAAARAQAERVGLSHWQVGSEQKASGAELTDPDCGKMHRCSVCAFLNVC